MVRLLGFSVVGGLSSFGGKRKKQQQRRQSKCETKRSDNEKKKTKRDRHRHKKKRKEKNKEMTASGFVWFHFCFLVWVVEEQGKVFGNKWVLWK